MKKFTIDEITQAAASLFEPGEGPNIRTSEYARGVFELMGRLVLDFGGPGEGTDENALYYANLAALKLAGMELGNLSTHPNEWLEQQFECEYCAECGGDAQHHTAVPFLGNWFARCDYPSDDDGAMHDVIREFRGRMSGAVFKPLDRVIFRCPYKGPREVVVLRQLRNGDVWIGDSCVRNGQQKVKPSTLTYIGERPEGLLATPSHNRRCRDNLRRRQPHSLGDRRLDGSAPTARQGAGPCGSYLPVGHEPQNPSQTLRLT